MPGLEVSRCGGDGLKAVPATIANDRDWRLYTESLVQADAALTTGSQARALAAGQFKDMMTPAHERYPDLRGHRRARPERAFRVRRRDLATP